MNFFKKLFSSKKNQAKEEKPIQKNEPKTNQEKSNQPIEGIYSEEYFEKRYEVDNIEASMLDGCLKMVESYFMDNLKIEIATFPTRPDSSGIRVEALAAQNKATRMRTDSRTFHYDEARKVRS